MATLADVAKIVEIPEGWQLVDAVLCYEIISTDGRSEIHYDVFATQALLSYHLGLMEFVKVHMVLAGAAGDYDDDDEEDA